MASISAKIREALRNLRSDAEPRAPRPPSQETADDVNGENHNNESEGSSNNREEVFVEPENIKQEKKPKKKSKFGTSDKKGDTQDKNEKTFDTKTYNINTQAAGNVINIVKSPGCRWGHDFVYYLGPTQQNSANKPSGNINPEEEHIEKTNEIILLMEDNTTPEHEYIDYVAKNLGKNWHSFFKRLGYTKGRIETFEIDECRNGVSEARYKLLLDWIRNDGTLGHLATTLWAEGERQIVKELSVIYNTNNKKSNF